MGKGILRSIDILPAVTRDGDPSRRTGATTIKNGPSEGIYKGEI